VQLLARMLPLVFFGGMAAAQITNVTDVTNTPVSGTGHDYIKLLNETVNPANGSVSVRIDLPVPQQGRGPAIPFGLAYDSNGAASIIDNPVSLGRASWAVPQNPWYSGGWSYDLPTLSEFHGQETIPGTNPPDTCGWWGDFLFTDPSGARHALALPFRSSYLPFMALHAPYKRSTTVRRNSFNPSFQAASFLLTKCLRL
jgi:hypothetical protein